MAMALLPDEQAHTCQEQTEQCLFCPNSQHSWCAQHQSACSHSCSIVLAAPSACKTNDSGVRRQSYASGNTVQNWSCSKPDMKLKNCQLVRPCLPHWSDIKVSPPPTPPPLPSPPSLAGHHILNKYKEIMKILNQSFSMSEIQQTFVEYMALIPRW